VIRKEKNLLEFELPSEDHTFCNLLVNMLNKHPNVKFASYRIEHPLIRIPRVYVETDSNKNPEEVLIEISEKIVKIYDDIKKKFIAALNERKR